MSFKTKLFLFLGILFYVSSCGLIVYYTVLEFSILSITSPMERIKIILFVILLMHLGSLFIKKINESISRKLSKFNIIIWFILYIVMLLNLTLFDKYFGRNSNILYSLGHNDSGLDLWSNVNLSPFKTINNYILAMKNGNLSQTSFIYNIFGNIIAFVPLALFLPRLFKYSKNIIVFLFITSSFIISIEFMQMFMRCGSMDIDDYILNVLGALIFFLIFNNKWTEKYIDKFLNLEQNKKA